MLSGHEYDRHDNVKQLRLAVTVLIDSLGLISSDAARHWSHMDFCLSLALADTCTTQSNGHIDYEKRDTKRVERRETQCSRLQTHRLVEAPAEIDRNVEVSHRLTIWR